MAEKYSRVLRAVTEKPWAIRQSMLDTICAVVQARANGVELTKEEIQARVGVEAARPTQQIIGTVGIIPVTGILAQKMNMFLDISGGTSYQQLIKDFRAMRDDPQVKVIVFEHDSPGGEVAGLLEVAEEIYAARGTKRLIAVVNPQCASASYFLAAACPEIVITPSGEAGCIGTIWCHYSYAKMNEQLGVDPTYIVSSEYKGEGNSDTALSEESIAYFQTWVDAYGDQFEKFVAKGRGIALSKVKSDFGQGRMLMAKDALKVGLVDKIATMDDTIAKLTGGGKRSTSARAEKPAIPVTAEVVADLDVTAAAAKKGDDAALGCGCAISCPCQDGNTEWCPEGCETCDPDCACQQRYAEDAKASTDTATAEPATRQAQADADYVSSTIALMD